MKQILLTQDKIALVDNEDYEWLSQWKWCVVKVKHTFYALRQTRKSENGLPKIMIFMHRSLLEKHDLLQPGHDTDHRDGDGLNNQKYNLRSVTRRQNVQNQVHGRKKTSQFPGVSWHKCAKKWCAEITINGKKKHLGVFEKEEDAALSYIVALKQIGEALI